MCVQRTATEQSLNLGCKKPAFVVAVSVNNGNRLHFKESRSLQVSNEAIKAMRRKLVWVESQIFQGWACSECAWAFNPLGPLVDESIEEMKEHYEAQRDKEFSSHICAEHPRAPRNPR
jgi:hypothetical protein